MNYRDALAPIWGLGVAHCGLWISTDQALPVAVNLATGEVEYITIIPSHGKERVSFGQWIEEQMIPIAPPKEKFYWELKHNVLPELEDFFLDYSESRHRNLATQASLTVLSSLLATRFMTPWKNGKVNLFHCTVCSSGSGKSAYLKGIDVIMKAVLQRNIRFEPPGTPEGLLQAASRQNFGLISVPEGARLLGASLGTPMEGLLPVLESVWSNEPLRGKMNRGESIAGTEVCLISCFLQMTRRQFDAVLENEDVATGGFASRTSWGKETPDAPSNDSDIEAIPPASAIDRLRCLCAPLARDMSENERKYHQELKDAPESRKDKVRPEPMQLFPFEALSFEHGAKQMFMDFRKDYQNQMKSLEANPCLQSMYVRQAEKILRESTLVCSYEQADVQKKQVTKDVLTKVRCFNDILLSEAKEHFNIADGGNEIDKLKIRILNKLAANDGPSRNRDLRNATKGKGKDGKSFETAIAQLLADGMITMSSSTGSVGEKKNMITLVRE